MTHKQADTLLDRERIAVAQQMMTAFFVLGKTGRMYETNNDSYRSQLARFCDLFDKYLGGRPSCTVKAVSDRLFVDEQFVNIDTDDRIGIQQMLVRWKELGIGGIIFGDTMMPDHVTTLLCHLWTFSPTAGDPLTQLQTQLARDGVDSVSLVARETIQEPEILELEDRQRIRLEARETFFRGVAAVREVMSAANRDEAIAIGRTRRIIHSIIDQISEDESALLELTSIKDFDDYTYAHCINVSVYSLTLGFRLGLSRQELSQLGFAALFHDIGKIKLPQDLITKKDIFDEFDWVQMRQHPVLGAMTIARTLRLEPHAARAIVAAYEHHINPDGSGYPPQQDPRPPNLYSRIIAITDNFDALTSGRVYIKEAIPPDEVLRKLMYQMSVKFDAFLLKQFVTVIGLYPVGSVVLLSNDTLGIVAKTNQLALNRPAVSIIADRSGPISPSRWCDLTDAANQSLDIVCILDAKEHGIDVTRYILTG